MSTQKFFGEKNSEIIGKTSSIMDNNTKHGEILEDNTILVIIFLTFVFFQLYEY